VRTVARAAAAVAALALGVSGWTPYAAGAPLPSALPSAEPVDLGGQPVDGSTDSQRPTALDAGLWTASLGAQGQPQYFVYERQIEDSTVHIGVVGTPPAVEYDGFTIAATVVTDEEPAGVDCGSGDASSDTTFPDAVIGDQVVVGDEDSADDPCRAVGTIAVKVERASTSTTDPMPIAIKVVEEAPVADRGEPVADDAELGYDLPEPGDPVDGPQGARSFDEAPILDAHDGPVTIAAEVTEGTTLLWRVPVDWGEQLVVLGELPTVAEDGPLLNVSVQVRLVQPSRDVFALTESGEYYYGNYVADERTRLIAASHALRYDNRYRDFEPMLPGDHWVAVSVEPAPEERAAMLAPVELTIAVASADEAEPTYKGAVLAQGGGSGPDGYSPDTPYLVGDGEFSAVASGNPFTPETEDEAWWGPRRGAGIGLGVVSLACCAGGAIWLSRRRAR